MAEAIVVVDASGFENIDNQAVNSINGQINRAENNDLSLFYVLPEGADLHEDIKEMTGAFSILRYSDEEDFYQDARIDEQIENRNIDEVTIIGISKKSEEVANKEKARGRAVGRPDHAGGSGGNDGNSGGGPHDHSNGRGAHGK